MPKYSISIERGTFDEANEFFRVKAVIGGLKVIPGFGSSPKEAIDNFVQNNDTSVLTKIFNTK